MNYIKFYVATFYLFAKTSGMKLQVRVDGKELDLGFPDIDPMDLHEHLALAELEENADIESYEEYVNKTISRRVKRSNDYDAGGGIDRSGSNCQERIERMRKGTQGQAVQFSLIVETKETAKLTCHYCGHHEDFKAMNWYRLQRKHKDGAFQFKEVGLDMHDDESENRVYKTIDHTLIIKHATVDDAGSYFCHNFETTDRLMKKSMKTEDIEMILTDTEKFRFFYHLDVLKPSKIPAVKVSLNSISMQPRPSESQIVEGKNLELFTEWQRWSACSKCGKKKGERKRLGICVIKKADPDSACTPWFLEAVMSSNPTGVPCRSSIFTEHVVIKTRPDEVLEERCKVKCTAANAKKGKAMKISGLTDVFFGKKKIGTLKKKIRAELGTDVFLICPGAQLDTMVMWLKNTRPLDSLAVQQQTEGRIEIDAHNVLRIHSISQRDAGKYQCIKDQKEQIEFTVSVYVDNRKDFWRYTSYLVMTYPFNFAVFLIFMIVKHRRQKVGVKLKEEQIALLKDTSSSSSASNTSGPSLSVTDDREMSSDTDSDS